MERRYKLAERCRKQDKHDVNWKDKMAQELELELEIEIGNSGNSNCSEELKINDGEPKVGEEKRMAARRRDWGEQIRAVCSGMESMTFS